VDWLYHASQVEMNEAKRKDLLQQAAAVMYEDPPHLFLTEGSDLYSVRPSVQGLVAEANLIWG
jgi:ABC-type transport system substrate-binding protein